MVELSEKLIRPSLGVLTAIESASSGTEGNPHPRASGTFMEVS
jgi:hypothetical protein